MVKPDPRQAYWDRFHAWEAEYERSQPLDVERNFRIFDDLLQEAVALGAWPRKDPWEGLEEKIEFVRKLHSIGRTDPSS